MSRASARIARNLSALDAAKIETRATIIAKRHRDLGLAGPLDGRTIDLTSEDRACLGAGRNLTAAEQSALTNAARRIIDLG